MALLFAGLPRMTPPVLPGAWAAMAQGASLLAISYANVVRHDASRIPPVPGVPKSAFLTVHTLAWELAHASSSLLATLGLAPAWLASFAHGCDAFVCGLGGLLFCAYYGLVHGEIASEAAARKAPSYVRDNHLIHAPTMLVPVVVAAAKDPRALAARPGTAAVVAAAAAYGAAYAAHATACAARSARAPYAFMRRLDGPAKRVGFWGGGVLFAAVPAALAAARLVDRLAAR